LVNWPQNPNRNGPRDHQNDRNYDPTGVEATADTTTTVPAVRTSINTTDLLMDDMSLFKAFFREKHEGSAKSHSDGEEVPLVIHRTPVL